MNTGLIGRDYPLKQMRQRLEEGMHCQVFGPSGVGKTTLVDAVVADLPSHRFRVVRVGAGDYDSEATFWDAVWRGLGESGPAPSLTEIDRRLKAVRSGGATPVIVMDDIDLIAERSRTFSPNFFFDLRGLATDSDAKVKYITVARRPLSEILPMSRTGSLFFGIFYLIPLGPLSPQEAEDYFTLERLPLDDADRSALRTARVILPVRLERLATARRSGKSLELALQEAAD